MQHFERTCSVSEQVLWTQKNRSRPQIAPPNHLPRQILITEDANHHLIQLREIKRRSEERDRKRKRHLTQFICVYVVKHKV